MLYRKKWKAVLFIAPAAVFFLVFIFYPFFMNIFNSLFEITALGGKAGEWNAFENYRTMFKDADMLTAIKNTFKLLVLVVVFQGGIALVLSLIVDAVGRGTQLYRTIYFFPMVISATALGLMFNLLYLYPDGPLNTIIASLGLEPIIWKDEAHAFWAMLIPTIWQYVGFYFVLYLTGINNISEDINEAAKLDGAVGLKRIRTITLPLMRPVLVTALVLQITGALKVFDLPWVMLGRGIPMDRSWLTGTYMYNVTYNTGDVDYASTIAILIVVLGVVISQVANAIFKEKDY